MLLLSLPNSCNLIHLPVNRRQNFFRWSKHDQLPSVIRSSYGNAHGRVSVHPLLSSNESHYLSGIIFKIFYEVLIADSFQSVISTREWAQCYAESTPVSEENINIPNCYQAYLQFAHDSYQMLFEAFGKRCPKSQIHVYLNYWMGIE